MTDPKFLKDVQSAGWSVQSVTEGGCVAQCPTSGCSMRAMISAGKQIPKRQVDQGPSQDIEIGGYDEARRILREKRRGLALTIGEMEIVSGIACDHAAKFERDDYSKPPHVQTFIEWAASLGYEVVLRPTDLPPITLRMISETRDRVAARQRRFELERQRDARPGALASARVVRSGK